MIDVTQVLIDKHICRPRKRNGTFAIFTISQLPGL